MKIAFFPTNGLNPWTGYGKTEAGLYRGLVSAGIDVDNAASVMLVTGNPRWCEKVRGYRIWLYTMSESTRVSATWVSIINRRVERVLLPCPELVDIYRESGVEVPCHFVGDGVDFSLPPYTRHRESPKRFTFLTYSLGDMRKGAQDVVMAFVKVFQRDPRFQLIVKCRPKRSWLTGCEEPNIRVVSGEVSERHWHRLLRQANCFLFPSRAEGWGMPPREATLAGLPTAATQWLGMWDVDQWGFPLMVREMQTCVYRPYEANAEGALWARPDPTALEAAMEWIAANYAQALAKARAGREYLLTNWSYRCLGERIAGLLREGA